MGLYFPVLKSQRAERWALKDLDNDTKRGVAPIVQLFPRTKPAAEEIADTTRDLARSWNTMRAPMVDVAWAGTATAEHPFETLGNQATSHGISVGPVVSDRSTELDLEAAAELARRQGAGAVVRLSSAAFLAPNLLTMLDRMRVGLDLDAPDIDLLLDLGEVTDATAPTHVAALMTVLPRLLASRARWRNVVVLGGSFPVNLGRVNARTLTTIPRPEWDIWNAITTKHPEVRFGDYGISHRDPVEPMDGRLLPIIPQIRYTTDDSFLIVKGRDIKRTPAPEARDICRMLMADARWDGRDFSAGDRWIEGCAAETELGGNYERWRRVSTNHHLTKVVDQLSRTSGSSGAS